jgi:hypothetical protein
MEDLRMSEKVFQKAEVVDLSLSIKYDSEGLHSSDVRTGGSISSEPVSEGCCARAGCMIQDIGFN